MINNYRLSRDSERERRSRLRLRVNDRLRGLRDRDLKFYESDINILLTNQLIEDIYLIANNI